MRCISPLLIRSVPKLSKAIGGSGMKRDYVPCGQCNFCLATKRQDWSFRLNQELKKSKTSYFLTYTYDDKYLPYSEFHETPTLRKEHLQLFTKRLRKGNSKLVPWPVRYYSVGEYGTETDRPHYHSIIFNLHQSVVNRISDYWQLGNCYVGDVNPASIGYVTKYVINRHRDNPAREPPFSLMSRNPGIGASYLETHTEWHRADLRNYAQVNGQISRLPRYYKEKIFSPTERAFLSEESLQLGELDYAKTVESLEDFHIDPLHYYDERIAVQHESITSKINLSNKF